MVTRVRVLINGAMGTGALERWSIGVNYAAAGTLSPSEAQVAAEDAAAAVAADWTSSVPNLKTLLSSSATITDVDVYSYGPTGPAVSAGSEVLGTPLTGSATITCPPQCAAVFSLRTALPGASGRGRVYWPALAPSISSALSSSVAGNASDDMATLLLSIQGTLTGAGVGSLGVYSPTLDVITPVTSIRSGNVIDTQRRRRDALAEVYETTPYLG